MKEQARFVILGAGPTGLGAAHRLAELGVADFLVLEQSDHAGGLAASFVDEHGFTWDVGGHVQFSHYDYFDGLMRAALGEAGWLHHQRESWVRMDGRFIPYPLQNNIRHLPKEKMWACLDGLIAANRAELAGAARPANFREWILARCGPGLAEAFMLPYNFKVWAHPAEELACDWVGERVAVTDLRRVIRNIVLEQDDLSWGPNRTFRFPRHGGTGAIWRRVAELVGARHFRHGAEAVAIDTERRVVRCGDGREFGYETLVSTLPLDVATRLLVPARRELSEAAGRLKYSSSNIVGLGLAGQPPESLRTKCWIYFPEDNCPFYRTTVFSNYSPNNVPDCERFWSLLTETSESPGKPVDQSTLVGETIRGCVNAGLLDDPARVVSVWRHRADHGYPTPSVGRDEILRVVLPGLEELGIYSRGRFGAWKYEVSNQDHSVMQGVELIDRLLHGTPETTLPFPDRANAGKGRAG
ncbi:MAG TPA: FAD-dependent oxidoreductase [Opitutus sp.]|nr:FAD-dependent oxidoreductase [Opitutus sp.]